MNPYSLQHPNADPPGRNELDSSKNDEVIIGNTIKSLSINNNKASSEKDRLKDLSLKSKAGSEVSECKGEEGLKEQTLYKVPGRWSAEEHDKFVKGNFSNNE